jgi:hypothetical protein
LHRFTNRYSPLDFGCEPQDVSHAKHKSQTNPITLFQWMVGMDNFQKILIAFLTNQAIRYLTVSVVPEISTNNLVSPLVAGPETNDPSELKFDP